MPSLGRPRRAHQRTRHRVPAHASRRDERSIKSMWTDDDYIQLFVVAAGHPPLVPALLLGPAAAGEEVLMSGSRALLPRSVDPSGPHRYHPDGPDLWPPDSIAVIGVGCRLPGNVASLDALWELLLAGRDVVTDAPPERFPAADYLAADAERPGRTCTLAGGFLDSLEEFDAAYFGVSPKEAAQVDPQQRLVLECAVEALDDAGIDPASLAGGDTSVAVGVSLRDYGHLQERRPRGWNAYTMSGTMLCNNANRLSYVLDLHGPSTIVDTACSSSLTAFHQACETVRSGRSGLALGGGVNVLLDPCDFVGFAKASMLSPTGRCHPFSALADGFARGEGAGIFVLKRLDAALADGDRVHAVVVGSALNSDGRTAGLFLPSFHAQAELLERVYTAAGISPEELLYLEAHGTGTQAGDSVECAALGQVLGTRRSRPLPIGSVKANLGHLESAAGAAGLLKALLVLRHRVIPATLHTQPLNGGIDFAGLGLAPVDAPLSVAAERGRLVGVNSFGFGGSNAHVALGAPPPAEEREQVLPAARPVVVSGHTPAACAAAAELLAERLGTAPSTGFYDLAHTTCRRRGLREYRAAVLADSAGEAAAALRAGGEQAVVAAVARGTVGFAFSGNGSQWAGMAADLLRQDAAFRAEVAAVDAELEPRLGWSVRAVLPRVSEEELARTEVAQPLLFAVQAGLVASLAACGIRPTAVTGHSVGEVAAAYCAGALDRAQACQVIAERSRAQARTAGSGRMAAAAVRPEEADALLSTHRGRLVVAGVNSHRDVTFSGDPAAIAELGRTLDRRGVFFRELPLDYAFHSSAMDPLRGPLLAALAGLKPTGGRTTLISAVSGMPVAGSELGPEYWWRNIREPVLFARAAQELLQRCDVVLEIGPHPVLAPYLRQVAADCDDERIVRATLRRAEPGVRHLRASVADLLACGAQVDWRAFFPVRAPVVDLPGYPWQRERHWSGGPGWWRQSAGTGEHPVLGGRLPGADPLWQRGYDPERDAWLADHTVGSVPVMPAAAFVDLAVSAAREVSTGPVELTDLVVERALPLPFDDPRAELSVQTSLGEGGRIRVFGRARAQDEWQRHATGRARRLFRERPTALDAHPATAGGERWSSERHHARCQRLLLDFGPAFRPLTELWVGEGEVLAWYSAPAGMASGPTAHPALLDGALQAGIPLLPTGDAESAPYLPDRFGRVRWWQPLPPDGLIRVRARGGTARELHWDVTIADRDGTVAMELTDCRLVRFDGARAAAQPVLAEVLRAAPLPCSDGSPAPLSDPASVVSEALAVLPPGCEDPSRFREYALDLTAHWTAAALRELLPGHPVVGPADAVAKGGVDPGRLDWLAVLFRVAEERGQLTPAGPDRWRLGPEPDPDAVLRRAVRDCPAQAALLHAYAYCGARFAAGLRGRQDPFELLFSEPDALAARFYDQSPYSQAGYLTARLLLRTVLASWPADRPLRVLEIGAGTGALAARLLPDLSADRTRYTFTDVSAAFFPAVRERLASYDFVDYRTLDLDLGPEEQGFEASGYDLVLASEALHTATDLAASLTSVARLLAPRGHLLAFEVHDELLAAPLFGALPSYWNRRDRTLRPRGPLLDAESWQPLLRECGFERTACVDGSSIGALRGHSVLLASRPDAEAADRRPPAARDSGWVISWAGTAGPGPFPHRLAELLEPAAPGRVQVTGPAADVPWRELFARERGRLGIVLCTDEPAGQDSVPAQRLTEEAVVGLAGLRAIARACEDRDGNIEPALWLAARSPALAPALPPGGVVTAAMWGGARSLANELPATPLRRIALLCPDDGPRAAPGQPDYEALARRLLDELLTESAEDEVLLTPPGRFVPRVRESAPRPTLYRGPRRPPFTAETSDIGRAFRVAWTAAERPDPGPGQVLITVEAAALNYRDIMTARGLVPEVPAAPGTPTAGGVGFECAGTVLALGSGTNDVRIGDRVATITAGALGSHVLARADRLLPVPEGMTCTEAVTLPVAFLTVQYGLGERARLSPGETVLVHGGAGGVGLAALQYAHLIGARVIATAGTEARRDLVRRLGAAHVLDSRSLAFADRVMDLTDGQGVDVVLNSLAGEAQVRGLRVLRPYGRFVELGKQDFLADNALPLARFLDNLAFHSVDVAALMAGTSSLADRQLAELAAAVRDGFYRPLPHQVYPATRLAEAFDSLRCSRHLGKVVVDLTGPAPVRQPITAPRLDPEAVYLVTGGLGGFGAATARHLADLGARHLELVGRRGVDAPEAGALLADLRERGVSATAHAADVADAAAMERILHTAIGSGRRLAGIVHAAMVLQDAPLTRLDDEQLRAVLAPKMTGGLVIDRLTRGRDLDFLLHYSSTSALVGNLSQSAYAAGNLALEQLAGARRAAGRQALAVQWPQITGTGYAHRTGIAQALDHRGLTGIPAEDALHQLDRVLGRVPASLPEHTVKIGPLDWTTAARSLPALAAPRTADLLKEDIDQAPPDLRQRIAQASPETLPTVVEDTLCQLLGQVLQADPDTLLRDRRLDHLGVDSLMATELSTLVRRAFDCDLPAIKITAAAGVTALAATILSRIPRSAPAPTPPRGGPPDHERRTR
ncbi:SDR family NAD(P)-dependent oxidoreductase [Kitasatospora sp. NPDC058046]|uniref:SDR family NAD(P)-dependent oxidoreductase n=1 Tax=Kitasatospora sp. NPDC058046 TaxID=3346312 RepID=UPI0036DEB1B1